MDAYRHQRHEVLRPVQLLALGAEAQNSGVVKRNAFGEHVINKLASGVRSRPRACLITGAQAGRDVLLAKSVP